MQRAAARWTCRRLRNTSSVYDMLDELEWSSLEARMEQSSLTFFYKIHSGTLGTVSIDKDKYLTLAPNIRSNMASHESQYTRYFAYSKAVKNSFFLRTIPVWNSLPSSWSHPRALRSLRLLYRPSPGGRLLVNCVPMREQMTTKITLNSVFDTLKLISLFTVSSQKVTLSNSVN